MFLIEGDKLRQLHEGLATISGGDPHDDAEHHIQLMGQRAERLRKLLPDFEKDGTPRDITPGPLAQVRPGEVRIYFAIPTPYGIGDTFPSYKEAETAARDRIKTFDYGHTKGCSREFVDVRIADEASDRMLHRVEVFKNPAPPP